MAVAKHRNVLVDRLARHLLTTLLLGLIVPDVLLGDEMMKSFLLFRVSRAVRLHPPSAGIWYRRLDMIL